MIYNYKDVAAHCMQLLYSKPENRKEDEAKQQTPQGIKVGMEKAMGRVIHYCDICTVFAISYKSCSDMGQTASWHKCSDMALSADPMP